MIPVCMPTLGEKEKEYVIDCLDTNWISAQGEYVDQFEQEFAAYCDGEYGVTTTSGTAALHLALRTLDIGEGDEVIIPTFTMGATAFSVLYCGAKPVLVDAKPDTWNMDTEAVADAVTDDTAAIMPVHVYGHPCDMDPILDIANEHDLYVIEDAAEAHGGEYRGKKVGTLGDIGCFSFYANKLATCGEGGMVVLDDPDLAARADHLKDLAYTADERFVHSEIGYNYRMTNVQAAIGLGQVERLDKLLTMRRENARIYNKRLGDIDGIQTPVERPWAKNIYWMYAVVLEGSFPVSRDELMSRLNDRGIETRRFFVPMHRQPFAEEFGLFVDESYPVAERIAEDGLYLPSTSHLSAEDIGIVCDSIEEIRQAE